MKSFRLSPKQEGVLWVLGLAYIYTLFMYRGYAEWYWIHLVRTTLTFGVLGALLTMSLRRLR